MPAASQLRSRSDRLREGCHEDASIAGGRLDEERPRSRRERQIAHEMAGGEPSWRQGRRFAIGTDCDHRDMSERKFGAVRVERREVELPGSLYIWICSPSGNAMV